MSPNFFLIVPTYYTSLDYRFELFKQFIEEFPDYYKLIVVDSTPSNFHKYVANLTYKKNIVYKYLDPSYGKGGAIREGIKLALSEATPDDIIGFQEPEKVNMLSIYPDIINQMHKNSLCILKRSSDSFSTLPKEQLYLEKYVNCFMEKSPVIVMIGHLVLFYFIIIVLNIF